MSLRAWMHENAWVWFHPDIWYFCLEERDLSWMSCTSHSSSVGSITCLFSSKRWASLMRVKSGAPFTVCCWFFFNLSYFKILCLISKCFLPFFFQSFNTWLSENKSMNVQEYKEKHNEQKEYFIDSTKCAESFYNGSKSLKEVTA
jgi:hypothetical protein